MEGENGMRDEGTVVENWRRGGSGYVQNLASGTRTSLTQRPQTRSASGWMYKSKHASSTTSASSVHIHDTRKKILTV